VEFYNPDAEEPECTAPPAIYEMKFVFTWSAVCHPDYYFPDESKWSPPTGASHNPGYRMWDACMDNASPGVGFELFSTATATEKVVPTTQRNSLQSMNCSFGYV
jgi:hypothetical protein